ncbi:hypothetical protein LG311_17825 [Sutcliffiella horikoshii]|uniref:hypothetical protein n=1 Tax=Sutcliffiella horikoshii TaxID=79883 RepID=UPI00384E28E6
MSKLERQLQQIEKITTDRLPIIVLRSLLMSKHFESTLKYYFPNGNVREEVLDHYCEYGNERFLYKELLQYLKLEVDDEIAEEIIDEKFVFLEEHTSDDLIELQKELIKWVHELDVMENK